MNRSIEGGIHPSKLKLAKVVPVFKSEDELDQTTTGQFHPVHGFFNRVFAKLMYSRLKLFLDKHNFL